MEKSILRFDLLFWFEEFYRKTSAGYFRYFQIKKIYYQIIRTPNIQVKFLGNTIELFFKLKLFWMKMR